MLCGWAGLKAKEMIMVGSGVGGEGLRPRLRGGVTPWSHKVK